MNRNEYLSALSKLLEGIPEQDKNEILYDYSEHFRIGQENGKTEEEIAQALGDVRVIARQFKADCSVRQAETNTSAGNILRAVVAACLLGFFNLVIVLGPFLGVVGALFGFFAASIGISAGGFGLFIGSILSPVLPMLVNLGGFDPVAAAFFAAGLMCLGVLFFIGNCYLARLLYKGTVRYLKWNIEFIRR